MAPDRARPDRAGGGAPGLDDEGRVAPSAASWLGLLHPDGPSVSDRSPSGQSDVRLLAPTAAELRHPAWLARALGVFARDMAADGIAYVAVPRAWRLHAVRVARRLGLHAGPWFLHVPSFASTQRLIPIEPRTLRYATGMLAAERRWVHRLLRPTLAAGGTPVVPFLAPSAGFVVRKPGARPLLEWLMSAPRTGLAVERGEGRGTAVVATSWRGPLGSVVLHRFRGDDSWPDVVVKVAPAGSAAALEMEAGNLARLGPDARSAGAAVPDCLALRAIGGRMALLQTALRGRPATGQLAGNPAQLPALALRLAAWLGRWHMVTRIEANSAAGRVASQVLGALDRLSPHVARSAAYRRWLLARFEALSSASIPVVAAHNDLTMWNVLVDVDGGLGVVDWEHATAESLPLVDLFYAMADAVMAAGRHTDRLAAVRACIGPGGPHVSQATRVWTRLSTDLGLPDALATVAFHACWIHHGANAAAQLRDRVDAHAFVDIVRWLAEHHVELRAGGRE